MLLKVKPVELICDDGCPVRKTADIIEGKWTTLIVRDLLPGKKRFSELLRAVEGISPKMLTARLKMLESRGLVEKTIYPVIPPKTEYRLSPLGRELEAVIIAMAQFGDRLG